MQIAAFDDLQGPATCIGNNLGHFWPLIARIGEDTLDEGEGAARRAEQFAGTVTILHIGGMNADAQQEAERIDEDMALATRDLLARIEALRVKRRAPF